MKNHRSPISGIATSNQFVATAGYDNQVILWDMATNKKIKSISHDHLVNQCEFSLCGNYLVTASSDYTGRIYSVPELNLITTLKCQADDVEMSTFHPTKKLVATASRDAIVRVYDFDGNIIHRFGGHTADVISVCWSEKGDKIYSCSDDGTLRVWSTKGDRCKVIDLGGVETDTLVLFNDALIFAGNDNGEILTITEGNIAKRHKFFNSGIKRIIKDPVNKGFLALSYDRTFKYFKLNDQNGFELNEQGVLPDIVWPRSASLAGENILFSTFGDCYAIYNRKTKTWKTDHINETHGINSVSARDTDLFTIGDSGNLKCNGISINNIGSLCNFIGFSNDILLTGGQAGKLFNGHTSEVIYQSESPLNCMTTWSINNSDYFAVGTYTGEVLLFVNKNGQIKFLHEIKVLKNAIKGICSNDKEIFLVGAAGDAAFINIDSFVIDHLGVVHEKIANACVHIKKHLFASVSRDLNLRLFSGTQHLTIETPHTHSIKSISSGFEGRYIATGSYYGYLGVYDLDKSVWLYFERISSSGISNIIYNIDKRQFVASSYSGQTYSIKLEGNNEKKRIFELA